MRDLLRGFAVVGLAVTATAQDTITIGSKNFTESAMLAEVMAQVIEAHTDLEVRRRTNLGGTTICWNALLEGEIDLYADYTGTGWAIVLKETGVVPDSLRTYLHVDRRYRDEYGVRWLDPFGLDNTYALAMPESRAEELGITRISDLLAHQDDLRAGFSIEFSNREDGYLGLARVYGLQLGEVRSMEHGLAYQALHAGSIDLTDAYSTDAKLLRYRLRVLEDDRSFFPPYHAAPLVREQTLRDHPELEPALTRLAFRIPDAVAQALNFTIEAEQQSIPATVRAFLEREQLVEGEDPEAAAARAILDRVIASPEAAAAETNGPARGLFGTLGERADYLLQLVLQHLALTLAAVFAATAIAVPLGIAMVGRPRLRQVALGVAGVVQTIPSLALLAFMIPFLGLHVTSAITALFIYAVLPILRNTYTGIVSVDPALVEAAHGIGLRPGEVLRRVQIPLALRTIMGGIRTATVISIGVATLAAFIGAGGLGEPIIEGLYLDHTGLILAGAIPAAALAVFADLSLGWLERRMQPAALRSQSTTIA